MRGFTLIELLVVVAIFGLLLTLAVPSFNDLILSTRIKGAASDIYASFALARSEALKRNANVTVGPTPAGASWTGGWQVAVGASVLNTHGPAANLRIECPNGTDCNQTLTYSGSGRLVSGVPAGQPTALLNVDVLSPPTSRRVPMRCVQIDLSGRVSVLVDNNRDGDCTNG
jgi:type IV fimbrial biogenesis protein FimT